jgi:predicted alpha/beta-hydrolase family hydrolase
MAGEVEGSGHGHDEASLRAFEASFLRAHGPLPPGVACPIGWQPSALTPVFYGVRDLGTAEGAPGPLRVFFPSLDGDVFTGAVLEGCGRYPVIIFAHGDCQGDADHYRRWFVLPAQLARSGYVVVVPQLPAIDAHPSAPDHPAQARLAASLRWIREGWEHRDVLLPEPATGIGGHSFGALHAGILATKVPARAVASLSGVWIDWPDAVGPRPIETLALPQLFTWGTEPFSERDAALTDGLWQRVDRPRHRGVFANGEHWDYLYTEQTPCESSRGPCRYLGAAARDLVAMFFAKYLPPELWPNLPSQVPDNLRPPPLVLTPEQEFYAGGHLIGFTLFEQDAACSVALHADLPTDRTVPYVLYSPVVVAARDVRDSDLVPVFTGGAGHGVRWVATQSPLPGRTVTAGSTVRMGVRTGPVP